MIRKFSINFGRKYSPVKIYLFSIFHILDQSRVIIIIIYSKPYSLQILVLCTAYSSVWCSCIYHFLKTINLIHLNISLEMGKSSPSLHNYVGKLPTQKKACRYILEELYNEYGRVLQEMGFFRREDWLWEIYLKFVFPSHTETQIVGKAA